MYFTEANGFRPWNDSRALETPTGELLNYRQFIKWSDDRAQIATVSVLPGGLAELTKMTGLRVREDGTYELLDPEDSRYVSRFKVVGDMVVQVAFVSTPSKSADEFLASIELEGAK